MQFESDPKSDSQVGKGHILVSYNWKNCELLLFPCDITLVKRHNSSLSTLSQPDSSSMYVFQSVLNYVRKIEMYYSVSSLQAKARDIAPDMPAS